MLEAVKDIESSDFQLEVKTANYWINLARKTPLPRSLFGELWMEREMAVLFGDTGMGKTVLAMQLAESIASGRPFAPLRPAAKPQKVVYIDFEMSEKQFEMRYSEDHQGGRARFLHNHYRFSENLYRVQIDAAELAGRSAGVTAARVSRCIAKLANTTDARIFVIDNLSCLKRSFYGSGELVPVMRALKVLQRERGLSILVLAHAPRRDGSRPMNIDGLHGNKMIAGLADNVFAIGQSRLGASGRYIKHINARSNALLCDASHVPLFELKKIGGNFLGFDYRNYAPELELLNDIRNEREWKLIERIKQMTDEGISLRLIANDLDMPKTSVYRLLKMWRQPVDVAQQTADLSDGPTEEQPFKPPQNAAPVEYVQPAPVDDWRPPVEAYRGEFTDRYLVSIGQRPAWRDKLLREQEKRSEEDGSPVASSPGVSSPHVSKGSDGNLQPPAAAGGSDSGVGSPRARRPALPPGLKPSLDGYGREIFIEQQDPLGKPMIWYQYDGNTLKRMERRGFSIQISRVETG